MGLAWHGVATSVRAGLCFRFSGLSLCNCQDSFVPDRRGRACSCPETPGALYMCMIISGRVHRKCRVYVLEVHVRECDNEGGGGGGGMRALGERDHHLFVVVALRIAGRD